MGFYYSLYEWYNPLWKSDRKKYVADHMHPQFKDVVTRYKPSIIFSDGEWDMPAEDWRAPELLAWLFNESAVKDEVIVNDRWGKGTRHKHGTYWTTEYTAGLSDANQLWEESRGMGHSYGYNRAEKLQDYRTDRELILMLIDLVSRGGNLLLDIGPAADGRIPVIQEERLLQLGRWLDNGEAIYGTRPWVRSRQWTEGEQPKLEQGEYMIRYEVTDYVDQKKPGQAVIQAFFTKKGNDVYAIIPGWPGTEFTLKNATAGSDLQVQMLGRAGALKWSAAGGNIRVTMPEASSDAAKAQYAHVLRFRGLKTDQVRP
jgi:alpha-L-fucosidase